MFKKREKETTQFYYHIWEDGIPERMGVDWAEYALYMEEFLPMAVRNGQVVLIQVMSPEGELYMYWEFFRLDEQDYQIKHVVGIPLEEGSYKFGTTVL